MIKQIRLQNFQKHLDRTIDLDRVTTIIGRNGKGKTAIQRAFRFLCLNKPRGDKFITRGLKNGKTIITLLTEKDKIVRIRSKSKNIYKLNGEVFKAFGTGKVPEPIQQILNVDELNFQRQHDPLFMFVDTPGQVSKRLNQIFDLGSIDVALSNIATMSRKARSELEVSNDRLKQAIKDKQELEWAVEFHKDIQRLLVLEKRDTEKRHKIASLSILIQDARLHKIDVDRSSNAILNAAKAIQLGRRAKEKREQLLTLRKLLSKAEECLEVIKKPVPDLEQLLSVRGDADKAAEKHRDLEYLVNKALQARKRLCRLQKKLKRSKKALPKSCPVCKRPIQNKKQGLNYSGEPT